MDFHFLHAADIHLDSPLRGLAGYEGAPVDRFRSATRAALSRLVDHAVDSGTAFLIVAGDLFDGDWKDFSTGLFLTAQLERLRAAGIRVAVIAGNHDAESRLTRSLPWPETVHRFPADRAETVVWEDLGVALHGRSFAVPAVTENLAAGYPPALPGRLNIGVLHTALEGHAAHATYAPCSLAQLQGHGYDYWALGHVHERRILGEAPWIAYAGNLQGRHARETGPKGCLSVSVRDGRIVAVSPVDLDAVRWLAVSADASGADDAQAVEARAAAAIADAVAAEAGGRPVAVRLAIAGETPAHGALVTGFRDLEAALRARLMGIAEDAWLERVRLDTSPPGPQRNAGPAAADPDVLSGLLTDAEADPAVAEALAAALRPLADRLPRELLGTDREALAGEAPMVAALSAGDLAGLVARLRGDLQALAAGGGDAG